MSNFRPINIDHTRPRSQNEYVERQQQRQQEALMRRANTRQESLSDPFKKLRTNMSVQQLLIQFNKLPRPEICANKRDRNHWTISIRHVPLQPESDVLFLVLNNGTFVHACGPARLLHLTNAIERADYVLPMLLKSFTSSFDTGMPPMAPWSWSIRESMLAQSLELAFQSLGLRKELQKIQVATDEENFASDREWARFRKTLLEIVAMPPERLPKLPYTPMPIPPQPHTPILRPARPNPLERTRSA